MSYETSIAILNFILLICGGAIMIVAVADLMNKDYWGAFKNFCWATVVIISSFA